MRILPSPLFEPKIFTANLTRPQMLAQVRIRYKNRPLAITWHFVAVQDFARGRPAFQFGKISFHQRTKYIFGEGFEINCETKLTIGISR